MKNPKHPKKKLKDLSPLEVVLLAMEKVYREFLAGSSIVRELEKMEKESGS
jgi:hypothetical protein